MHAQTVYLGSLNFIGLDSDLSIYLLLIFCLMWIAATRSMKLSWSWPIYTKATSIALVAIFALTTGPKSILAIIGWSLFLILYVTPIILFKKLNQAMVEMNSDQLIRYARILQIFNWGKSGQCLYDSVKALCYSLDGENNKADELLNRWLKEDTGQKTQNQFYDTRLQGYAFARDWPRIIEEYDSARGKGTPIGNLLYLTAGRAYIECGKFNECAQCLQHVQSPRSANELYYLALVLLQFYCLTGDDRRANELLNILAYYQYNLPQLAKNYWLGRLSLARAETDKAKTLFALASQSAHKSPAWQKRIEEQTKILQENSLTKTGFGNAYGPIATALAAEEPALSVEKARQMLEKSMRVQELLRPKRKSSAVTILIAVILLVFFIANSYSFFPNRITYMIEMSCMNYGILVPANVLAGEYWRLITFLFLHAHLVHALVNILALFWLGRMCEKIYGTPSFLIVYFASGILSGIVSVVFCPSLPAVGASGAIMGVFGAIGAGIFRLRDFLPASIRSRQLKLMIGLLIFQLIVDQIIPHIDAFAHIGGLVTGIVLGLILPISYTNKANTG